MHLAERVLVRGSCSTSRRRWRSARPPVTKADVALGVTLAVGHAATVRSNRVGLVASAARSERTPTQGRAARRPAARTPRRLRGRPHGRDTLAQGARPAGSSAPACARGGRLDFGALTTGVARSCGSQDATRSSRSRCATRAGEKSRYVGRTIWLVDPEERPRRPRGRRRTQAAHRFATQPAPAMSAPPLPASSRAWGRARRPSTDRDWLRDPPSPCGGPADDLRLAHGAPRAARDPLLAGVYLLAAPSTPRRRALRQPRARAEPRRLSPRWRRWVPPALALASLALLVVGIARPHVVRDVTRNEATIVLAMDTSRSMQAADVQPSRFAAAKPAALAFLEEVPDDYSVGIVSFSTSADPVLPPTVDREAAAPRSPSCAWAPGPRSGRRSTGRSTWPSTARVTSRPSRRAIAPRPPSCSSRRRPDGR